MDHCLVILASAEEMPARPKVLCDRAIRREKTLGMARGLKPLRALLPLTGRPVRVLRAVIQIPVLAMFYSREQLSLGGAVALQLVLSTLRPIMLDRRTLLL